MNSSDLLKKVKVYSIDKKYAAACQIDTAIELFFRERDDVSIIALTYAAWHIIKDISKAQGKKTTRDYFVEGEAAQEKRDILRQTDALWNFLKHAKNDEKDEFQFLEGLSERLLFSVVCDFSMLWSVSISMGIFRLWMLACRFDECSEIVGLDIYQKSILAFPAIKKKSAAYQKQTGLQCLLSVIEKNKSSTAPAQP
jgi:hypothetical protein